MAMRYGWTFNGAHYSVCESVRLSSPITTYHRNGVRMTEREWRRMMDADRRADAKQNAA